ncbi:phosphoglycerate dehydrogenase-like enzyme [Rhodococcus sp. OK519]|uniref:D-2-hydroxyacid dehydrogenase n=1 Tax=Rhodococcus sp. OK519 TaxID=2135729 RepID=UPI000D45C567|nr:phosphoglycerate dehydrogenase-like enzyme [Rhodococcus sp. OK519]
MLTRTCAGPTVRQVGLLQPGRLHGDGTGEAAAQRLRAQYPEIDFVRIPYECPSGRSVRPDSLPVHVRERLADVDVVLCLDLPPDIEAWAPGLHWIQSVATGTESLPVQRLREAGIRVTNAAGTAAPEIAEFVFARILEHRKRLPELATVAQGQAWTPIYGRGLEGAALGLLGFGEINRRVARVAAAFGMSTHVCRRSVGETPDGVAEVAALSDLPGFLGRCEIVVAALPDTSETRGLLDRKALSAMPDGALLINVGRGSLVDEAALLDELQSGRISVALDVVAEEPLGAASPLWDSGARISAHCASVPAMSIERVVDLFAANIGRLLAGRDLINQIEDRSNETELR